MIPSVMLPGTGATLPLTVPAVAFSPHAPDRTRRATLVLPSNNAPTTIIRVRAFDDENHTPASSWYERAKVDLRTKGCATAWFFHFAGSLHGSHRAAHRRQLSHDVRSSAYSLQNNPGVFIAGLRCGGFPARLLWAVVHSGHSFETLAKRRRCARAIWSFAGTAIALSSLSLPHLSSPARPPPAIVFVFVLAIWCLVAFA